MAGITTLAFAAAFLLVFGLNLLLTDVKRKRQETVQERLRQERRVFQTERTRQTVENADLYGLAAERAADVSSRRPLHERTELFFEQAGVKLRPMQVVGLGILFSGGAAAALWLLTEDWSVASFAGLLCGALPCMYVAFVRRRRMEQLLSQLSDAFELISRMMRAGQTFHQGMQVAANEGSSPLADEFGYCSDQQNLGMSPDAALRDLARRTGLLEIRIFVLAVVVHRQTGGNLSELLEKLAQVIRERYRIRGVIRAVTAEGRAQAGILLALPVVLLVLLTALNPSYTRQLYDHPSLLTITVFSMTVGGIWMQRIVRSNY